MNGIDTQLRVIDEIDVNDDDLAKWSATSSSSEFVSIYLPTHRAGREVTQDPVLYRRLVANAAGEVDAGERIAAAARLVDDRAIDHRVGGRERERDEHVHHDVRSDESCARGGRF